VEHRRVVARRRMVRRYRDDPVEPAALDRIAAAATRGPSAGFAQGVSVVVVTDRATRTAIAGLAGEPGFAAAGFHPWLSIAPAHIVLCVEPESYRKRYRATDKDPAALDLPWWWVDGGAALSLLLLAAVDEGYAAGFLGGHRLSGIHAVLDIPSHVEVVGIVTVGFPAPDRRSSSLDRGRRPLTELVHRERWGADPG
jgi:nitroreductase